MSIMTITKKETKMTYSKSKSTSKKVEKSTEKPSGISAWEKPSGISAWEVVLIPIVMVGTILSLILLLGN